MKRLPVTVLSGFLGAGKTSVLNHILHQAHGLKIAVIVNDMSEVNIDANLVAKEHALTRTDERLVEMSNGCICCTLREDLMIEIEKLAKKQAFDYLVIESTGISEPIPVAQTFTFVNEEEGIDLSQFSFIDCMVTVVDAFNFFKDFASDQRLVDAKLSDLDGDDRTIVNLLVDQIEFANILVINKIDLVSPEQLEQLQAVLKRLNPDALQFTVQEGKVPVRAIVNTGLFDYEKAENSAGWIKELNADHTPETEEYGISSFVFRTRLPFHHTRFWNYINESFPSTIIRSKGMFWIASRPDQALNWGQAGGSLRADPAGVWWASMPYEERLRYPSFHEYREAIEERWDAQFGDRMNELVFIGQGMDKARIQSELKACICTEEEATHYLIEQGDHDDWPLPKLVRN